MTAMGWGRWGNGGESRNCCPTVLGRTSWFISLIVFGKTIDIQDEISFLTFPKGENWHKTQMCCLDHRGVEEKQRLCWHLLVCGTVVC